MIELNKFIEKSQAAFNKSIPPGTEVTPHCKAAGLALALLRYAECQEDEERTNFAEKNRKPREDRDLYRSAAMQTELALSQSLRLSNLASRDILESYKETFPKKPQFSLGY